MKDPGGLYMNIFFQSLIKKKLLIPIIFAALTVISIGLLPFVNVSYDMASFLPKDSPTKQAVNLAIEEFAYPGNAVAMAKGVTIGEALEIKSSLRAVSGVKSVIWLDDVIDIKAPLSFYPADTVETYYKNSSALFHLEFYTDNYSLQTTQSIDEIVKNLPELVIAGDAQNARHMKNVLSGEIISIIIIVLPICLLILLLASHSWLEPLMYLITIGISIVINMGTNAFFDNISFITNSMASVLQLAICMDYSIFLMHRYYEERDLGNDIKTAVKKASVESFTSVSASALTTIGGFIALLFMKYKIGADVGLVLAKGIGISFITVMVLMPVLINIFGKTLDKARHKFWLPSLGGAGRFAYKARYLLIVLLIIIIVPSFLAQRKNSFFYGDNSVTTGEGQAYENRMAIADVFGASGYIMIIIPRRSVGEEVSLVKELSDAPYTKSVLSAVTAADPAIPASFLPASFRSAFMTDNYSRLILYLNIEGENAAMFDAVSTIRSIIKSHYPDEWYAAGVSTSLSDIRDTVERDSSVVLVISLMFVGLVIMLVFRSISIPVLLLLVIQGSVWLNMSIPYFSDFRLAFIGYLVISSLQLGATIDYGILLTNRYISFRSSNPPKESLVLALKTCGSSILVSALILATAGFCFGIVSQLSSISELGILIGRGAVLSCVMTLFILPGLLSVFDKIIFKSTLKGRVKK